MEPPTAPPPGSPPSSGGPARAGSGEAAFAEHVLPQVDTLYRVALSLTRNHADAEDLVQDTLLRAYRSIDRFDGRYPRAWLLTILRNANINRHRRRRPEPLRNPHEALARLEATASAGGNVEEKVVGSTFDAAVESSLWELSVKLRQVVELVDIDELTYEEAAEALGVPVGTVMSRLHRGRRRMRARLAEAGIAPRSKVR